MPRTPLVATLLLTPLLASCGMLKTEEPPRPITVTAEAEAAARSANAFGFDLYARLKERDGNLFFSPAGIATALAMTSAGAEGETADQMASVLRLDGRGEAVHAGFGTLTDVLNSGGEGYRLRSANRLFGATGYPLDPAFVGLLERRYRAEPVSLDFGDPAGAAEEINDWVAGRTNGRIKDIVGPRTLSKDTRLVLANALHFKGRWHDEFSEGRTKDAPFRLAAGGETNVPLMHQTGYYGYAEADGVQVLELPYDGGDLSMVVLLPEEVGLARLEETLTAESVAERIEALERREVEVFLPKFETTSSLSLAETLAALGMPRAFDRDQAEFGGMTTADEPLFLSAVLHKTFVAVDEKGTEAAAATVIAATAAAAEGPPETPPVFRADRPFVYLICDRRTGAVLFLGRLVDPTG